MLGSDKKWNFGWMNACVVASLDEEVEGGKLSGEMGAAIRPNLLVSGLSALGKHIGSCHSLTSYSKYPLSDKHPIDVRLFPPPGRGTGGRPRNGPFGSERRRLRVAVTGSLRNAADKDASLTSLL